MNRRKIQYAGLLCIIVILLLIVFWIFLSSKKASHTPAWFREISVEVETGSIMSIPDSVALSWNWGDSRQPSLQHSPIIFNTSYSDARLFINKKGNISIRDAKKIIHQKQIDEQAYTLLFRFTPDLQGFYYVLYRWSESDHSSLYTIVTNNWISEEYNEMSQPVFSTDGKHLAFVAQKLSATSIVAGIPRSRITEVILDGKSIASYDSQTINELNMSDPSVSFNPVNNKLAYYIKDQTFDERVRGNSFVVYDGVKGPIFDYIDEAPVFSEDGSSMAYEAYKRGLFLSVHSTVKNEATVVCNGNEGPIAGSVRDIVFSKDGATCGYIGRQGNRPQENIVVINGKIVNQSETAIFSNLQIGEKGTVAYSIGDCRAGGNNCATQVGDKRLERWGFFQLVSKDEIPIFEVAKLTDELKADKREPLHGVSLAIDSEVGKAADSIHDIIIDNNKRIVAYVADVDKKKYLMIGSTYVGPYDDVWPPIFQNDSIVTGVRSGKEILRMTIHVKDIDSDSQSKSSEAGKQTSKKASKSKQWTDVLYNATEAAQYWMNRRSASGGITISWLDTSQPLPVMDAVDLLRLNDKLKMTVDNISSLISKKEMSLTASGGEIFDGKITQWWQGQSTTTPLQKPLTEYIEESLRSGLKFLLIGSVSEGKYAKSDVFFLTADCFQDSVETFMCDTSYHMVLLTPDHHFLRLINYSDFSGDIGALSFLEDSDIRIVNSFNPPVIPVPNSQIPLVNIDTSRGRSPVSRDNENSIKSAFKDATTGVEMFTMGDECCIARNNNGTWGVYQFDFDQMALRSKSRQDILSAPSLSTGVLYFMNNDGTPNEKSYTHNSTAQCGGEFPSYELRLSKISKKELSQRYEQIGIIANDIPVYRDKLTKEQIDHPAKDDWLYGFYLQRFMYVGAENPANWKVFYDSLPVIWIPDPLGGLVGFVNARYPFPAECEGRSYFNGSQW